MNAPADDSPQPLLEIEGLEHHLSDKDRHEEFVIYVRQNIVVQEGDFVALLGPSGCGKTTLLTVLGLLRRPTHLDGLKQFAIFSREENDQHTRIDLRQAWLQGQQRRIELIRRRYLGFALQTGELLPALTVRENIAVPLQLNRVPKRECFQRVDELMQVFGFRGSAGDQKPSSNGSTNDLSRARINKLSGGEYQRVSLARAIAHRPRLVFVDEPTAALNRELARGALRQFQELQQQRHHHGATIMITHDEDLADEFANLTIRMAPMKNVAAGEVVEVVRKSTVARPPPVTEQ